MVEDVVGDVAALGDGLGLVELPVDAEINPALAVPTVNRVDGIFGRLVCRNRGRGTEAGSEEIMKTECVRVIAEG